MQQTGLNLIAISIFTITLSILLGPLFNISPFIPAGTTFFIMGLITFDTLSWQNKGINLLLEVFASQEEKERIIYHEAGHFLAAYFLNIPITGYSLTVWESLREGNLGNLGVIFDTESLAEKENIPLILERLSTVLMAGIEAEKMIYGDCRGGENDRVKLRKILLDFGVDQGYFQQKENWAKLQAKNILERNKDSYEQLVIALRERQSIKNCCFKIQK